MIPVLINLMQNEQTKKMQTQATSVVLNFVQGLVQDPDDESNGEIDGREILSPYT